MAPLLDTGTQLRLRQREDGSFALSPFRVPLGALQRRSGVPERALKRWIEAGVLGPTKDTQHAGKGNHRVFFAAEVIVAALLAPLATATLTLGRLFEMSRIFRHALRERRLPPIDDLDQRYRVLGQSMLRATQGIGANLVAFTVTPDAIYFEPWNDQNGPPPLFDASRFLAQSGAAGAIVILDLTAHLKGVLD
jgi:hypothetical protein